MKSACNSCHFSLQNQCPDFVLTSVATTKAGDLLAVDIDIVHTLPCARQKKQQKQHNGRCVDVGSCDKLQKLSSSTFCHCCGDSKLQLSSFNTAPLVIPGIAFRVHVATISENKCSQLNNVGNQLYVFMCMCLSWHDRGFQMCSLD